MNNELVSAILALPAPERSNIILHLFKRQQTVDRLKRLGNMPVIPDGKRNGG